MRAAVIRAVLLIITVLAPVSAFAQASLTGTVRDPSGAVLPGVTVEVSSPALIERTRTAVTDGSGLYRIVDLRPGTYGMSFTLPGFTTVRREGIVLAGTATLTIPIEMKVGDLQETITVTGETPVVDVQNTRRETVLGADVISALPATRAYGSVLNVTPGLTVDNNGLAATPTMTFFSAHGGNSNEGRMQINGMTVAAAFNGGGVSSLSYNTSDAEEVSVLVSGGLGESETGGPSMNIVPRAGGNRFAGQAFLSNAGDWSTGDNIDDELRAIGIDQAPGIISMYDASASLGGPILRDKLWFYGSYRDYVTSTNVEGISANRFAGDPSHWDYEEDPSIRARLVQGRKIWTARFTSQITSKNRLTFSQENQYRCEGTTLTVQGEGCRKRGEDWIGLGSTTLSPESATTGGYFDMPYWVTQATWTSPLTNKLLLEAGYTRFAYEHAGGPGQKAPDGIFNLIPVQEQSARDGHRANFTYRGMTSYNDNFGNPNNWRASASYVTGRNNMKFGYQGAYLLADTEVVANDTLLSYRFRDGVPNQVTYRLQNFQTRNITKSAAFYAQDTWTHGKLSLQGALRYDHVSSYSPEEHNGTQTLTIFNPAPITTPRTASVDAYNDISPRMGAAYDVFGNGKTALKFNLGRYLSPATNDTVYTLNSPGAKIVTSVARNWTDTNGNLVVDCDLTNPAAQSAVDTCAALTGNSLNFGQTGAGQTVNQDVLHGWGKRPVDWQYGLTVSQQLLPRVSFEASYNRRWWGNFTVTDNLAVSNQDYESYTVTAPSDSRLPGGGGYPVTVYTLSAAAARRPSENYVTWETDYGDARTRYWHGVDLTLNARLKGNLVLQGGTTTGRQVQDTCDTTTKYDSPDRRNCRSVDPFRTDFRGNASYTVPKVDVLVSGTLRSQSSSGLTVSYLVPNVCASCSTDIQRLLGRLPAGALANGTTTVTLNDADHRLYADNRRTQVDMRFAKIIRFASRRLDIGIDLTNLLNTNYATGYESQYTFFNPSQPGTANGGSWNDPTTILAPRFVRLNF
jgi:hypothetical protein